MIVFNVSLLESYYAQNSTLIIDECKRMTRIAKYMIQKEFANFIIRRQHAVDKRLKRVWSWIKNDKVWKEFHKKFKEFEDDYSDIVSLIRQTRDFIKLRQEVVITIVNEWESKFKCFNAFSLHTMRAIRKCAIRYFLVKALQITKRAMLHRLSRTKQEIFRSLMFNVANWFKVALNFYRKKLLSEDLLEKYKVDNFESFLRRKDESMKFSQLSNEQSQIVYMLQRHHWRRHHRRRHHRRRHHRRRHCYE